MYASFIMGGDLIPVSLKGDGVWDELFKVTAVAWTPEGSIQIFGYGLMGLHEGALPLMSSSHMLEVWSRGLV